MFHTFPYNLKADIGAAGAVISSMHIQCPNCKTTYNVSDSLISTEAPTFRCSRCKHTFVLEINRESKPARRNVALQGRHDQQDEKEREMSLPFLQPAKTSEEVPKDQKPDTPAAEMSYPTDEHKTAATRDGSDEHWSLPFPPDDRAQTPAAHNNETIAKPLSLQNEPEFEKSWWTPPQQSDEKQDASRLSTAPYLGLFLILLLLYSWFALNHSARPGQTEKLLRFIPGMESAVFKNDHLKQGILVQSIDQNAQLIRGNREVFTISGTVVNRNPVGVREVRLEGYIFNGEGTQIGRQLISVGNPISANLLRDMEAKEVSILQEIGPQKRFSIPPDESAPFIIVFLKPPKEIKSFAVRILAAEAS